MEIKKIIVVVKNGVISVKYIIPVTLTWETFIEYMHMTVKARKFMAEITFN